MSNEQKDHLREQWEDEILEDFYREYPHINHRDDPQSFWMWRYNHVADKLYSKGKLEDELYLAQQRANFYAKKLALEGYNDVVFFGGSEMRPDLLDVAITMWEGSNGKS